MDGNSTGGFLVGVGLAILAVIFFIISLLSSVAMIAGMKAGALMTCVAAGAMALTLLVIFLFSHRMAKLYVVIQLFVLFVAWLLSHLAFHWI
jgi:hypothetical protein